MYSPNYTLTRKLSDNLLEIERLYGRLEALRAPRELLLTLERENLIQSAFSSNSIEGNPLSQAEVSNLLLNDRIPVNRDEKEVVNYFGILKQLPDHAANEMTTSFVLAMHKMLMQGVRDDIVGTIRTKKIVVGHRDLDGSLIIKHDPPHHDRDMIERALSELIRWVVVAPEQAIIKAGLFHHQFVYIHPFEDGNGRVCRILTAYLLLKHGYQINKYFVLDDYYDIDRYSYSDSLHKADLGNGTAWLEYFTDGVKYSLQSALGKIETGLQRTHFDMRPTPREQEALSHIITLRQVTTAQIAYELKVTRQQASKLLGGLIEKGYVLKFGSTKNSYYTTK